MRRFRLSRQARADLRAIWVSVAALASPEAATRLLDQIEDHCQLLGTYPKSGRLREDLADLLPGARALPVGRYEILHRPAKGGVDILRVVHGRRDLRRLLTSGR